MKIWTDKESACFYFSKKIKDNIFFIDFCFAKTTRLNKLCFCLVCRLHECYTITNYLDDYKPIYRLCYISIQNNTFLIPKMEVVSQELVKELTNIGLGIGVTIIDLAMKKYPNLKELKINNQIPNVQVFLAIKKSISLTFASKTFLRYLISIF